MQSWFSSAEQRLQGAHLNHRIEPLPGTVSDDLSAPAAGPPGKSMTAAAPSL